MIYLTAREQQRLAKYLVLCLLEKFTMVAYWKIYRVIFGLEKVTCEQCGTKTNKPTSHKCN